MLYDEIGTDYSRTRRTDPRIAAAVWEALGDADAVLNVGAGTGSYEPPGRHVVALEPSRTMIAQRLSAQGSVVRRRADAMPFTNGAFDATMAILSDHHWDNRRLGLVELRRVARRRVVLFNFDPSMSNAFWLARDYLPGFLTSPADRESQKLPFLQSRPPVRCLGHGLPAPSTRRRVAVALAAVTAAAISAIGGHSMMTSLLIFAILLVVNAITMVVAPIIILPRRGSRERLGSPRLPH